MGASLASFGILVTWIAPHRGDAWGFMGVAMIPIGFLICYLAGGVHG